MGSLMQCLLRSCLEREPDDDADQHHDDDDDDSYQPPRPTLPARMARSFPYTETSMNEDEDEQDDCCHPDAANPSPPTHTDEQSALHAFWKNLRASWRHYDSLESPPPPPPTHPKEVLHSPSSTISNSPLRTASSFDDSSGLFPAINPEEIVLPGSALQKLMASKMSESMEDMGDECVICMEGFSQDNPRMPTLCGCGENKTYFHLPCLYQWMEQNKNCPSCRKRLRWEEF